MEILNFKFLLLFTKMWNHRTSFVFNNGGLCLQNSLSVRWHGFYLILGFCVSWLVVTGVGFIIGSWMLGFLLGLLFGGYVWYWVCLFVGWQVCNNAF